MTDKKAWSRPELLVLVRSRPEEAVLENCKKDAGLTGSNDENSACYVAACGVDCNSLIGS